jgi:hypothetical protein
MKSGWEIYKGRKYFAARYDHLTLEEVRAEVSEVKKHMASITDKNMLVLVDTTGTLVSPEVLNLYKDVASASEKYVCKTAMLGMTGARRMFLDIVSKFAKVKVVSFDDVQQAKDWLVS